VAILPTKFTIFFFSLGLPSGLSIWTAAVSEEAPEEV
jgi:hypothetical protein